MAKKWPNKDNVGKISPMAAQAIEWIADNDAPGDDASVEELEGYLTVCLVADVFNLHEVFVAKAVRAIRAEKAKVSS